VLSGELSTPVGNHRAATRRMDALICGILGHCAAAMVDWCDALLAEAAGLVNELRV
jgi:hypothetical protein